MENYVFENHILPFILKRRPGKLLPFSEYPELWRELRDEANFYALDDLAEMLATYTTHSCPFQAGNDRGVLYWLGTDKARVITRTLMILPCPRSAIPFSKEATNVV